MIRSEINANRQDAKEDKIREEEREPLVPRQRRERGRFFSPLVLPLLASLASWRFDFLTGMPGIISPPERPQRPHLPPSGMRHDEMLKT